MGLATPVETLDVEPIELPDVTDLGSLWDVLQASLESLATGVVARLPLLVIALLVLVVGLVAVRYVVRGVERGLTRSRVDNTVERLVSNLLRVALVTAVLLVALSLTGIQVGAVLAGLGIAGLALAFALQNILENFVAGVLILVRKPFRRGDQIVTNGFEGTVDDIDLRVTRVIDFDGQLNLLPNATVFTEPLTNLTRLGRRRTTVTVGIDYRDDHDAAREVLRDAVTGVDGVLADPAPEVLLTELGDSSVDFQVRYWTTPQMRHVRLVQDRVLSACKTAVEAAGMTIPWPIRTLAADVDPLVVRRPERRGTERIGC